MKIEFSTYLHDNDMSFDPREYLDGKWANMSENDRTIYLAYRDKIIEHFKGEREKPFYEIELRCTLDLDTYEIEIVRLVE